MHLAFALVCDDRGNAGIIPAAHHLVRTERTRFPIEKREEMGDG
jgi:hypothetical protein